MNFCTDGYVKSGATPSDTWIRMLQEINGVSESHAQALALHYPSLTNLLNAYENLPLKQARLLLASIPVSDPKN